MGTKHPMWCHKDAKLKVGWRPSHGEDGGVGKKKKKKKLIRADNNNYGSH